MTLFGEKGDKESDQKEKGIAAGQKYSNANNNSGSKLSKDEEESMEFSRVQSIFGVPLTFFLLQNKFAFTWKEIRTQYLR
jgi:hypothetical protein